MVNGREHLQYSRLILPLAADGQTIDMFLLVISDLERIEAGGASQPRFDGF